MGAVGILGYFGFNAVIAGRVKERPASTVAITNGLLIMVLYVLAMFRRMSWINGLWIAVSLYLAVQLIRGDQSVRSAIRQCLDTDMLTLLLILAGIFLLQRGRLTTHVDDLGVWTLETKSLYLLDGFAEKYRNTAVDFGDYYPGQMLFEAWACMLKPDQFSEGLMYTAYYWLYISFLSPIISRFSCGRRRIMSIPLAALLGTLGLALPSVVGILEYRMLSVELLMSAAFGACLFAYFDQAEHTRTFVRLRCFICTFFLLFLKESGLMYAVMALVYGLVLQRFRRSRCGETLCASALRAKDILGCFILALAAAWTWAVYCRVMGRASYFDPIIQNSIQTVSQGEYVLDEFSSQIVQSMMKAVVLRPLSAYGGAMISLTPLAFWIALAIVAIGMCRMRILCAREAAQFGVFYGVSAVIFLISLAGMHIFVFREDRYIYPEEMIYTISRYGEPLFLGVLVFLVLMFVLQERTRMGNQGGVLNTSNMRIGNW